MLNILDKIKIKRILYVCVYRFIDKDIKKAKNYKNNKNNV